MNRATCLLALLVFAVLSVVASQAYSQDAPNNVKPAPEDKPAAESSGDAKSDTKKDDDKEDNKEDEIKAEDLGVPVDFNDYIKKLYPSLDPGGEHDLFNLKNYTDKDKRFHYTANMVQLILVYMNDLGMGSTIAKLFDQYSRGKLGTQPTFKVLHATVMLYYPPGQPNITGAQKLLREAAEKAPDYAYPWLVLSQIEFARFAGMMRAGGEASPRDVLKVLDKAIELRPDFMRAIVTKGQVYMQATPPRTQEVATMIAPWVKADKLPQDPDECEDVLRLYVASHKADEFFALAKTLTTSNKLLARQRVALDQFSGEVAIQVHKIDEAIDYLESAAKFANPELYPDAAMRAHRALAVCWNSKAMDIRADDETLEKPGNKEKFDQFVAEVTRHNLECAQIETRYLPLNLRGQAALQYANYLWRGVDKGEDAKNWLEKYLADNDLTTVQRNQAENLRDLINLDLNPTEDGLIDRYEGQVKRDEIEGLAKSLGLVAVAYSRSGEHFKHQRSLDFFVTQLHSRNRLVVEFAGWLAADTAMQIGGDQIEKTARVIAERLDEETEMNSEQQARLQEKLSAAIKLTGHRPSQERAVRRIAKLVNEAKDNTDVRTLMRGPVNVWTDEEFLGSLKPPMDTPSRTKMFRADSSAEWLEDLADHIKDEIAAEASKPKTGE